MALRGADGDRLGSRAVRPLAVVGNLSRDLVAGGARPGGGPYHAARALRLLGGPAVLVTKLADSDREALLPPLLALGIPVRSHPASTTSAFSFSYKGEVRTMQVDELGDAWTPEDVRGWVAPAIGRAEWVHVAALTRSDFPPETLAALGRGRRLLLDGQGLVRPSKTGPLVLDAGYDRAMLRHVTILKLAEEEARVLLPDLGEPSLRGLGVPEVLVTFGSRGSIVWADGHVERIPARAIDRDPTGAGDAFSAAYLDARSRGYSPIGAARRATATVAAVLAGRNR
jgi:prepilin-type processing-associated H-X9-DG protein